MATSNPSPPNPGGPGDATKLARPLRLAIAVLLGLGLAAVLYGIGSALFHPAGPVARGPAGVSGGPGTATLAAADHTLHRLSVPTPPDSSPKAPSAPFTGPDGKPVTLADFKGKVVVLNLWATWCPPCRKEMPSLAALATTLKGRPVEVVALSTDTAAATDKAKAFIAQNAPLAFYQDPTSSLPFKFDPPVEGFPTTFIVDKQGRVRSVARADLDWTAEGVRKVITKLEAE
jgi:thiol-disulfide isomerase/thioredoxin